tara:strand:+ start:211951 stop:212403 length:453 start_codon:yes stop_codon:yes gene_type:complete
LTYLLIAFVVALALAPLSHFVPSKRQRAVAGMREYAAVHGLYVEFRNLPGQKSTPGPAVHKGDIIYYGKRLPTRVRTPVQPCSWLFRAGEWRSLNTRIAAPVAFTDLPPQVLGASVDEVSCGVYWDESGGQDAVEQITRALDVWSRELVG